LYQHSRGNLFLQQAKDTSSPDMGVTEYQYFRNKESMKAASFLCSRVSCAPQEIPGWRKLQVW